MSLSAAATTAATSTIDTTTTTKNKKRTRSRRSGGDDGSLSSSASSSKVPKVLEEDSIEHIETSIKEDSTFNTTTNKTTTTTTTSLTEMLSQALSSNDKDLLEMCFAVMDMGKVRNSIRALPAAKVLPLLKALVARIRSKAIRSQQLLQWIEALFHSQLSTLLMTPGLEGHLGELKSLIESRSKSYRRMLQLKGRLDLLLHSQRLPNLSDDLLALPLEEPSVIFDEESGSGSEDGGDFGSSDDEEEENTFGTDEDNDDENDKDLSEEEEDDDENDNDNEDFSEEEEEEDDE